MSRGQVLKLWHSKKATSWDGCMIFLSRFRLKKHRNFLWQLSCQRVHADLKTDPRFQFLCKTLKTNRVDLNSLVNKKLRDKNPCFISIILNKLLKILCRFFNRKIPLNWDCWAQQLLSTHCSVARKWKDCLTCTLHDLSVLRTFWWITVCGCRKVCFYTTQEQQKRRLHWSTLCCRVSPYQNPIVIRTSGPYAKSTKHAAVHQRSPAFFFSRKMTIFKTLEVIVSLHLGNGIAFATVLMGQAFLVLFSRFSPAKRRLL